MSIQEELLEKQIKEELERIDATKDLIKEPETHNNTMDSVQKDQVKEASQFSSLELEQMEKGWDPNHEGPNKVSAEEFKRVGEIIDAKRKASREAQLKSKEVEELTTTVRQLVEHNKLLAKTAQEQKLRELEVKKIESIQQGDVASVVAVEKEYEAIKAMNIVQDAPKVIPPSPEVQAFLDENASWVKGTSTEDIKMQNFLKAQVQFYMNTDPDIDEKVAITEIKGLLAAKFPDKFIVEKPKQSKVGVSTVSTSTSKGNAAVSLTLDERQLFESIRSVDNKFTIDQFNDMYLKHKK